MYVIEVQRKKWGFWTPWRVWNGGRQRYQSATDADEFRDLVSRVWPQYRFRITQVPHA